MSFSLHMLTSLLKTSNPIYVSDVCELHGDVRFNAVRMEIPIDRACHLGQMEANLFLAVLLVK